MRLAALVGLTALCSGSAAAEPTFLLHAIPSDFSACESIETSALRCDDLNPSVPGNDDYFAWVIVSDVGGEASGAAFGISYDPGVNVATWVPCGAQQVPDGSWPASGNGVALAWPCASTPANDMVKLGFFFVQSGSSGRMRFIEHPGFVDYENGGLVTTDCGGANTATVRGCEYNGSLVFDGSGGYVPNGCRCSGPQAVEASWSAIKNEFRDP